MKGLILKDFYTMSSTLKVYTFLILVYVAVFGIMENNPVSAIMVSTLVISMSPVTALAYDEQSKWDKMARTMPVTPKTIVLAKYIFSLLMAVAAAVFSTAAIIIVDKFRNTSDCLIAMVMAIQLAMFYHSLLFPTIYKFGTTKGRIYTMLIMFIPAIIVALLSFVGFWTSAVIIMLTDYGELCAAAIVLLIILMYIGSIGLSVKIYKNKDL